MHCASLPSTLRPPPPPLLPSLPFSPPQSYPPRALAWLLTFRGPQLLIPAPRNSTNERSANPRSNKIREELHKIDQGINISGRRGATMRISLLSETCQERFKQLTDVMGVAQAHQGHASMRPTDTNDKTINRRGRGVHLCTHCTLFSLDTTIRIQVGVRSETNSNISDKWRHHISWAL